MTGIPSRASRAQDVARRILANGFAPTNEPRAAAAGMQRAFDRFNENLCRVVGDDGYKALFARALAEVEAGHPALRDICKVKDGGVRIDDIATSVTIHGLPVVRSAIESLLAAVVGVLAQLIGEDMVVRILDNDVIRVSPSDGKAAP